MLSADDRYAFFLNSQLTRRTKDRYIVWHILIQDSSDW